MESPVQAASPGGRRAGWTAAGAPAHGGYEEKKAGEYRWQRAGSGRVVAGSEGFRGRDAGETAGSRVESHEIRGRMLPVRSLQMMAGLRWVRHPLPLHGVFPLAQGQGRQLSGRSITRQG